MSIGYLYYVYITYLNLCTTGQPVLNKVFSALIFSWTLPCVATAEAERVEQDDAEGKMSCCAEACDPGQQPVNNTAWSVSQASTSDGYQQSIGCSTGEHY